MILRKLRERYAKQERRRRRQRRLWKKTRRGGHRKAYREAGFAMRKLKGLLNQIRKGRIDWNGNEPLPLSRRKMRRAAKWVLSEVDGLYISSTVRFDSVTYHGPSSRRAIDFGSDDIAERPEREAHSLLLEHFGPEYFLELFGPDNSGWVRNGSTFTASEGEFLETLHDNHVHAAA